jgi:hypothetical protein
MLLGIGRNKRDLGGASFFEIGRDSLSLVSCKGSRAYQGLCNFFSEERRCRTV